MIPHKCPTNLPIIIPWVIVLIIRWVRVLIIRWVRVLNSCLVISCYINIYSIYQLYIYCIYKITYTHTYIYLYIYIHTHIYIYPNNPLRVPFDLHLPSDFALGAAPARGPPLRSGALPGPARARGSGGGGTLQGAGGLGLPGKVGKPMVEPLKPHEIYGDDMGFMENVSVKSSQWDEGEDGEDG